MLRCTISLRNVNLRLRSECQFALTSGQDIRYVHYTTTSGRRFLATEEGEDSVAGPSQRTYFAEPKSAYKMNAKCSRQLATLRKKATKSAYHRNHKSNRRTIKSRKHVLRILALSVFRLILQVTIVLYCSLDCLTPVPHTPSAHSTWCGTRHHTHA